MNIDNKSYQTDMFDMQNLRYLLFTNLYGNDACINSLKQSIANNIDTLSIDYCCLSHTFTVKIKKTSMKKIYGFEHDPIFYHGIISKIFLEFLQQNESLVYAVLSNKYVNPREVLDSIYANCNMMSNLCTISCIADNIIIITL